MKSLSILVICILITFSNAMEITQYGDCAPNGSGISRITVEPCSSEPCQFAAGTDVTLGADFISNRDSATAKLQVRVQVAGFWVTYYEADACTPDGGGLNCPLKGGDLLSFSYKATTSTNIPKGKMPQKWKILDGSGKDIVCIDITVVFT